MLLSIGFGAVVGIGAVALVWVIGMTLARLW